LIAIDVEAHEMNHNAITEIGITTLDSRDIQNTAPGKDGKNWWPMTRCRHFRIQEYKYHANSRFVNGCPESFEFGESEFVQLSDARHVIESCFKEPFSRAMTEKEIAASFDMLNFANGDAAKEKRKILLVGHNPSADIDYLEKIGYSPLKCENLVEVLDTAALHRAYGHKAQSTSLSNILYEFDIVGWNLHNAGNDAAYTMQTLIAIAVRAAAQRGKKEAMEEREECERKRLAEKINDVVEQIHSEQKEWSDGESGDDGGSPEAFGAKPVLPIGMTNGNGELVDPYKRTSGGNRKKALNRRSTNDRIIHGSRRDYLCNQMFPSEKKYYASDDGCITVSENGQTSVHRPNELDANIPDTTGDAVDGFARSTNSPAGDEDVDSTENARGATSTLEELVCDPSEIPPPVEMGAW
jgi:hypothetical protein